ncbi:hypothetical protein GmRootV15_66990 (plasmid) [Variovorax sp. V15]
MKSAKLVANRGTIDSKVVNARLPATWGKRSFRARSMVRLIRANMYRWEKRGGVDRCRGGKSGHRWGRL